MTTIERNYWDQNIPLRGDDCCYSREDSTEIGGKFYYGPSLKDRLGRKVAMIVFEVVPVIAFSILFAPIFALTGVYRDMYRKILEVHYDREFKFVSIHLDFSRTLLAPGECSTSLPQEVTELIWKNEVMFRRRPEVFKYFAFLRRVCKVWNYIANKLEIEFINLGWLALESFPLITIKNDIFNYIRFYNKELRRLDLPNSFTWEDPDLRVIRLACPELKKLSVQLGKKVTGQELASFEHLEVLSLTGKDDGFSELLQLSGKIKSLKLRAGVCDADIKRIVSLNPDIEELELFRVRCVTDACLTDIAQLKKLKSLVIAGCPQLQDYRLISDFPDLQVLQISQDRFKTSYYPTFVNLPSLRKLYLRLNGNMIKVLPNFDHLTQLKSLNITVWEGAIQIPSLEALTQLKDLDIQGEGINQIPSLNALTQLNNLSLANLAISSIPSLVSLANLKTLTAYNLPIKDWPLLPDTIESLSLADCQLPGILPVIHHLHNLEFLNLEGNNIDQLPQNYFDTLTKLRRLYVTNKSYQGQFPSLDALKNLRTLGLEIC